MLLHPMLLRALVAMVLIAPLPFGAFPVWAWSAIAAGTGTLVLSWGFLATTGHTALVRPPSTVWWCVVPFVLAMLWALFQSVEFSPASLHHPLWRSAAEALGTPYNGSISLDPMASRESIVRIVAYAGIFWLALQLGRDPRRARSMFGAVAIASTGYALYGLAVEFSGARTILWFEKTAYVDVVTATFVNRNSFATYAGLGLLCTTAMIWDRLVRPGEESLPSRERLRRLLGEHLPRNALFLGAWPMLAVALLLSESRAGAAATVLALLVFFSSLAARRSASARALFFTAIALVLAGSALLALSGKGLEQRLWATESDWETRREIYAQTGRAIRDAPVLGTGLGTFASVYRIYGFGRVGPGVNMAHNDYLEMALELGVPAALCFFFSLFALALNCVHGVLTRRRDSVLPALGFAACTLVGVHALVDFSMQLPAIATTFALVLGAATAQSWRSGETQ